MSEFNKIATEFLQEWTIEEGKSKLFWGAIGIALFFLGKFVIWPKIIEIWDKINRT